MNGHSHSAHQPIANFDKSALDLDVAAETERITTWLRQAVHQRLRRKGAVVGISGGVDSSVVLALCVKAFGTDRVVGILLPERESSPDSTQLALKVAQHYGVQTVTEDITAALEGFGCYRRRDEAIRRVFPEYGPGWKARIVLPGNLLEQETLNFFLLKVTSPDGQEYSKRLPPREYYEIVAASNFKQRTRMAMLYYHAELRNYAVVGTANRDEHDLGFFVKHGDGGVDVSPIAHLFKTQVYQLAQHLGVPEEIRARKPTTDTYSAGGTQEEFFFRVPFEVLDVVWAGREAGVPMEVIAQALELTPEQVARIATDIGRKQRTTAYLRMPVMRLSK
ncbi:MAG: NAD(+) synthase [Chloroflexi bacterium]|nr:NAD(+) synthase [Chloroflexota bacterium]